MRRISIFGSHAVQGRLHCPQFNAQPIHGCFYGAVIDRPGTRIRTSIISNSLCVCARVRFSHFRAYSCGLH